MDFVIGERRNPGPLGELLGEMQQFADLEGTFYVGYPVLAGPDGSITIDALLTSAQHGCVIIDVPVLQSGAVDGATWEELLRQQEAKFSALKGRLVSMSELSHRREFKVPIQLITYVPDQRLTERVPAEISQEFVFAVRGLLPSALDGCGTMDARYLRPLNAAIQRVTTIKPRKRRQNVTRPASCGGIIKRIEQEIANLDRWQKKGAIESPVGPQRIRGLAGSGKTVLLALKAAYLHAQHPEWKIAVTYHTRSLHQQLVDLVRRFSFEHSLDEPDWSRIQIMNAWGSRSSPGVYSLVATAVGLAPLDFNSARRKFGYDAAFDGACQEVLGEIEKHGCEPVFDAVLIDEAQDLPSSFMRLAYHSLSKPHRITLAYDELQNLSNYSMEPPESLFGVDNGSRPLVALRNEHGEPAADVMLPRCYRNTPWALTTAHALGFGVYRDGGLVQMFADQELWWDIGYEVLAGSLTPGADVSLRRHFNSYPEYFAELLSQSASVEFKIFDDERSQAVAVAQLVAKLLGEGELEATDILIIFPDPVRVPQQAASLIAALRECDVSSHIAGVTSSADEFWVDGSVTIASIYRAKGNEAPFVFVLNTEYCFDGPELARKRNMLFTAITRSRAWVRVCGVGEEMQGLKKEYERVVANDFRLNFRVPTASELEQIRRVHRDVSPEEKRRRKEVHEAARKLVTAIKAGDVEAEDIDLDIREELARLLGERDQ